jgi:hypothetical protein
MMLAELGMATMSRNDTGSLKGAFLGPCQTEWDDDGRHMRLLRDLVFVDPRAEAWTAPAGATVDGASIPRACWSLIGGPFEGRYRKASVIHDWYCDRRTRSWQAVHRVFYDAMIASAVSLPKAKLLYYAVVVGGPRWNEQAVLNNNLGSRDHRFEAAFLSDDPIAQRRARWEITMMSQEAIQKHAEHMQRLSNAAKLVNDAAMIPIRHLR